MPKHDVLYVLDSYALVAYFKKQPGWQQVENLLEEAESSDQKMLMSLINWGEVIYSRILVVGVEEAIRSETVIDNFPIDIIAPDREMTRQAATFKAMGGISYADCFAAALAVKRKATLVTGDREFAKLEKKNLIKVLWI